MKNNDFNDFERSVLERFPLERWRDYRLAFAVSGGADSVALIRAFVEIARKISLSPSLVPQTFRSDSFDAKKKPENFSLTQNDSDESKKPPLKNRSTERFPAQNDSKTNDSTENDPVAFSSLLRNFLIVHINHQLRGEESENDAAFVRDLARSLSVAFVEEKIDREELQNETRNLGSLEAAARNLRYQRLIAATERFGARFVLTAHSQNDQWETLLQRLFRGTGLEGLTGIQPFRPLNDAIVLIRPLLNQTRNDVVRYLNSLGQNYRVDSSNLELCFTRNRIRLELIPLLEEIFPRRWNSALNRLQRQSSDLLSQIVQPEIDALERKFQNNVRSTLSNERLVLDLQAFRNEPEYIVQEFFRKVWKDRDWSLREMGWEQWRRLTRSALNSIPSTSEFPGGIVAKIEDDRLVLEKTNDRNFHKKTSGK